MSYATERRFLEIERRLRWLDVRTRREEDRSWEDLQLWATAPIKPPKWPPAPPPPPPPPTGVVTHCCVAEIPFNLTAYEGSPATTTYPMTYSAGASTVYINSGGAWLGTHPVFGTRKVYCGDASGTGSWGWYFEGGGFPQPVQNLVCNPFLAQWFSLNFRVEA